MGQINNELVSHMPRFHALFTESAVPDFRKVLCYLLSSRVEKVKLSDVPSPALVNASTFTSYSAALPNPVRRSDLASAIVSFSLSL